MDVQPILTEANTKLAEAYALVDTLVFDNVVRKLAQDCTYTRSNSTYDIINMLSALLYVHMIYLDIIDPYTETLTEQEYKDKYEYTKHIKLFHKKGIHLHDIYDSYDFPTVISNN